MNIVRFIERSPAPIALDPAVVYLGAEPEGMAIDFTSMSMYIADRTTPGNSFIGNPNSKLIYTSPSPKWIYDITGTLVSGSTLRCDYDPVTHVSLGLLVEEQRTNLCLQSSVFDNASWGKVGATITANAVLAPDGTTTADTIVEDTASNNHNVGQNVTAPASGVLTASVFVKAAGRGFAVIDLFNNTVFPAGPFGITVNLTTGVVALGVGASLDSFSSKAIGSGWFLVSFSKTISAGGLASLTIRASQDGLFANRVYTGDGVSGISLWGAQVEVGAFPTSYIPTTTATVTRLWDQIYILGSAFGLKYPLTMVAEGYLNPLINGPSGNYYAMLNDNTLSNYITLADVGATRSQVFTGGVLQMDVQLATPTLGQLNKAAVAVATNDAVLCRLGVLTGVDTSVTPPVVDRLVVGNRRASDNTTQLNDHLMRLKIISRRCSNAELQAMTT